MPKYKVGDVAALFPKPSAPKSETGKKIQSMFDEFYKNSKKFDQKKNLTNNQAHPKSPNESKKIKRKFANIDDNELNTQDAAQSQIKQKKPKLDSSHHNSNGKTRQAEENYFPRNKKKSKHFNSVKENSSFSKMFNEDDEENFSHFDSEEQKVGDKKKKKFRLSEVFENDGIGKFKNKSSQKIQIFINSKNQSEEFNAAGTSSLDKPMEEKQQPEKKSKKKRKKKQKKDQIVQNEAVKQEIISEPEDDDEEPKFKQSKSKKLKQEIISEPEDDEQELKFTQCKSKKLKQEVISEPEDDEGEPKFTQSKSKKFKKPVFQNDKEEPKSKSKKLKRLISSKSNLNQNSETDKNFEEKDEFSKVNPSKKKLQKKPLEDAERLSRTLFVGNLPVKMTRHGLQKLFAPYGSIETCRLRGSVPVKATIPKKIAAIKSQFHAGQKSCIGYVVFKDAKLAAEALSLNGELIGDHHIVVNPASSTSEKKTYDEKRSIFIGNLPFDVEDEAIWSAFSACGEVEAVRAIRDQETGAGKGFGYVLFKNIDSKAAALKMENIEISNRKIRVKEVKSNLRKPVPSSNNKFNAMRRKAKKLKNNQDGPNSRKSLKKLMNREKLNYQKKKIASIFKKFST